MGLYSGEGGCLLSEDFLRLRFEGLTLELREGGFYGTYYFYLFFIFCYFLVVAEVYATTVLCVFCGIFYQSRFGECCLFAFCCLLSCYHTT